MEARWASLMMQSKGTLRIGLECPLMAQAVWKLLFGDRDEILIREVGLRRNNDSPTLPSGFNCCAKGLGTDVFTQPGLQADIQSPKIDFRCTPESGHSHDLG